jgi:hypothetical protein
MQKVKSVERREKIEKMGSRPLAISSDSSSSSEDEDAFMSLGGWPDWTHGFAAKLFDFGDHAAPMRSLFLAHDHTHLFFWAEKIIRKSQDDEDPEQPQQQKERGCCAFRHEVFCWIVCITSVLNLIVAVYDIVQAVRLGSWAFLFSAILRLVLLPFLSFFHFVAGFMFWGMCKDGLLKIVNIMCAIFAGVVFVAAIVLLIYFRGFNNFLQLDKLEPPSRFAVPTVSRTPENVVCQLSFESYSIWDLIGFALGPYEVERKPTVFTAQMQYFFGQDWDKRFTFEARTFNTMPIFVYRDRLSNVTVIGLRGVASGSELAFQL